MGRVFHRYPRDSYPVAVRGDGAYLIDREGKRYLDASGGAAVSCLGHSDASVVQAIQEQLARLPFAHTSFFTNEPMEALAEALIARAPAPLDKVYFVSGGSEAIEAALTLARQYFEEVHFRDSGVLTPLLLFHLDLPSLPSDPQLVKSLVVLERSATARGVSGCTAYGVYRRPG